MKARGLKRCPEVPWPTTSSQMQTTLMVERKTAMRWMMKKTKRMTMMATPLQRPVHAPPARSLTACPPCQSQLWPLPTLLLTFLIIQRLTSSATPTSLRCLATSPPCRVSRSHRRLRPVTRPGGSAVRQSTSEACSGRWVASYWFHPPPPWMKTSPSPPQTSPPPPPACPRPGWTTPAARPPFLLHPHLQPTDTSPHAATSRPTPDTSHPGGTSLLCVTSPPRGTWGYQGDTDETSPPGGDTSRCSPHSLGLRLQQGETTSATFHHEAATKG